MVSLVIGNRVLNSSDLLSSLSPDDVVVVTVQAQQTQVSSQEYEEFLVWKQVGTIAAKFSDLSI